MNAECGIRNATLGFALFRIPNSEFRIKQKQ